jgi:spore maturation protein CgeB
MDELISKIKYYLNEEPELENITKKAEKKVYEFGFDYESQLRKILGVILKKKSF